MKTTELRSDLVLSMVKQMLLVRRFEEKCAEVYSEQKIRGFLHLYIGEEAVGVGSIRALADDDAIVATYREHGHAIVRGISPDSVMAEMYGKIGGCAHGRGGSMHMFSAERRFYGGNGIVGGGLPIAVGLALADKLSGRARVTACFFGDGATDEGEFHESLNLAALWKLPVLFICENNLYSMGTAIARHEVGDLAKKPAAYGIPGVKVDGMRLADVYVATKQAAEAVRAGEGPRFLEMVTYRFRAHSMYDAEKYRDKAEVAEWKKRDPIDLAIAELREARWLDDPSQAELEREVAETVARAVAFAEASPLEPVSALEDGVYAGSVR